MKMAAVKKIVAESRRCIIETDAEGNKWIGDGRRFYALDEDIEVNRESVLAMLDVDRDKRSKITVFESQTSDERFSIYPKEQDDERLIPHMAVMYGGELVMIFMTEKREVFAVEHSVIKPAAEKLGVEYGLRRRVAFNEEMRPAIILKADMFVNAILMPLPAKVTLAIVASMGNITAGEVRPYGDDEKEEFFTESEEAE